jgi:glycosyltransferase involved in cell wall biosynthesis
VLGEFRAFLTFVLFARVVGRPCRGKRRLKNDKGKLKTMSVRVIAFIPMYRCERQIGRVLNQFACSKISDRFVEILALDNCSPDDTVGQAIETAKRLNLGKVTVARNQENYGLGGSHKAAFCYAIDRGFSHIAVLHGDDQGAVADLLPVLEAKQHLTFDCCLGARFHPQARISGYSLVRVLGNRMFNAGFSLISGRRLHDLGSGLNLYRTETLTSRYWWRFRDDLTFNYCMVLAHVALEQSITFFPISWREDDQISNARLFSQSWRTLGLLTRFARNQAQLLDAELRVTPRQAYCLDIVEERL